MTINPMNRQLADVNLKLKKKEIQFERDLQTVRSIADQELCELRRQLNKFQDSNAEWLEEVNRKHNEELGWSTNKPTPLDTTSQIICLLYSL